MSQKKRERTQIIYDILKAIKDKGDKVKPTHILYKSNLSHQMLQEYINELIEKDFIEENFDKKDNKTYSLKKKGYNFLYEYKIIREFLESYGLD
jgi:predicted transcriptional regulator